MCPTVHPQKPTSLMADSSANSSTTDSSRPGMVLFLSHCGVVALVRCGVVVLVRCGVVVLVRCGVVVLVRCGAVVLVRCGVAVLVHCGSRQSTRQVGLGRTLHHHEGTPYRPRRCQPTASTTSRIMPSGSSRVAWSKSPCSRCPGQARLPILQ